jgi:hypothetical protein
MTGQMLYYQRIHVYQDAGEMLFVQMRMSEHGESVPCTTDDRKGGTAKTHEDGDHRDLQDLRETLETVPSLSHAIIAQPRGRFAPLRKDTSYPLIPLSQHHYTAWQAGILSIKNPTKNPHNNTI